MSTFNRALLYVIRKKAKSLVLFLILLVLATFTLTGVAIKNATQTAQLNVRQSLGGIFTLEQNQNDSSKWVNSKVGSNGSTSYYSGAPLTKELSDYIEKNVPGINGSNATYTDHVVPTKDGKTLELIKSKDDSNGIGAGLSAYGDINSTVSSIASTNTLYDSYFTGGLVKLVKGKHFKDEDGNVALVSDKFAELNNLNVGDMITLKMSTESAKLRNINADNATCEVKIVGIFKETAKSSTMLSNWSMGNSIYTTMKVLKKARPDIGDEWFEKIQFQVNDPAKIDNIVDKVKHLPKIKPDDFLVNVDTSGTDSVMKPLDNMNRLMTVMIILVISIGAIILYLVLSSRIKDRIHETGVLLSLGISKLNISLQYLIEIVLVAAIALSCSIFTSNFLATTVGNQLLDYSLSSDVPTSDANDIKQVDGLTFANNETFAPKFSSKTSLTKIQVKIDYSTIIYVFASALLIVVLAVSLAAIPILKTKPREILSRMS